MEGINTSITEAEMVARAKELLRQHGKPDHGLRVGVRGGGCSGLSYFVDMESEARRGDVVLEFDGLQVYLDVKSQLFLAGLFLAAISAVPLALLGRVDVLQRNYLFSLFPASILLGWILERRVGLRLGWRITYPTLRIVFVVLLAAVVIMMPVTRYGVDPFQYIPSSSLKASSVAAQLDDRSILFLRPTEIGWRFLAPFNGSTSAARFQQPNMTGLPGGFIKSFSDATLPGFNLTFTGSDSSADYIMMADYVENLYILRFGAGSSTYENARSLFEANVSSRFNLVYSTGTDRIYANRHLG